MKMILKIFGLAVLVLLTQGIEPAEAGNIDTNINGCYGVLNVNASNLPSPERCTVSIVGSSPAPLNPTILNGSGGSINQDTGGITFPGNGTHSYRVDCTGGASATASFNVSACVPPTNTCTGTIPANAAAYSGDSDGNTAWTYSSTNTAAKCQFSCNSGSTWNGSSCVVGDPGVLGVTINASPNPIPYDGSGFPGGETNVTWTVTGSATSCTASQNPSSGIVVWNGSKNSTAGTHNQTISLQSNTTLTITCQGPSGTVQDDVFVLVTPPPQPPPTVSLTPETQTVPLNGTAYLTWTTTNATECNLSWLGWADPDGGSQGFGPLSPEGYRTYTITCRNSAGVTATDTAQVIIGNPPPPPPVPEEKLIVCPPSASIEEGETVTLASRYWSATTTDPTCSTGGYTTETNNSAWNVQTGGTYASVSSGAVVTGDNPGSATVRATFSGLFASSNITVTSSGGPSSGPRLLICPDNTNILVGGTANLEARYFSNATNPTCATPSGYSPVTNQSTWDSKDSEVTSQGNGVFLGNSLGIADVNASYNGSSGPFGMEVTVEDSATVTVTDGSGDPTPPIIGIDVDPTIVRSGERADVEVSITSETDVTCTLRGAVTDQINHIGVIGPSLYPFVTDPLTSARTVEVTCPGASQSERINVIPTFQEI